MPAYIHVQELHFNTCIKPEPAHTLMLPPTAPSCLLRRSVRDPKGNLLSCKSHCLGQMVDIIYKGMSGRCSSSGSTHGDQKFYQCLQAHLRSHVPNTWRSKVHKWERLKPKPSENLWSLADWCCNLKKDGFHQIRPYPTTSHLVTCQDRYAVQFQD